VAPAGLAAADRRCAAARSPEMLDLKLPTAKLDETNAKSKLRRRGTHLETGRSGRSDGEGDRGGAAELRQLLRSGGAARAGEERWSGAGRRGARGQLL
jgi:hypothetical protein